MLLEQNPTNQTHIIHSNMKHKYSEISIKFDEKAPKPRESPKKQISRGTGMVNMIVFWPGLRGALAQRSVTHAKTSTVSALSALTLLTCTVQ